MTLHPYLCINDESTDALYPLSLHDALPIYQSGGTIRTARSPACCGASETKAQMVFSEMSWKQAMKTAAANSQASQIDRKSTRLNSSHPSISYAVFCLKKKNDILEI